MVAYVWELLSMRGVGFSIVAAVSAAAVFRLSGKSYPGTQGLFIRGLSSVLLASCAVTFQLILCEVLQDGDHETRAWLWKFVTAVLLVILGIVAPFVQLWRIFAVRYPRFKVLALVFYAVYLFVFRFSSTQLPIERYVDEKNTTIESEMGEWFTLRQDSLACISFAGITTMALLCGISSVTAPYTAFFSDPGNVTEVDADRLERSIGSIDELIASKELEISRLRLDITRSRTKDQQTSSSSSSESGFMSRLVNMVRHSDHKETELRNCLMEQDALLRLKSEVQTDLENVRQRISQQQYYSTLLGRIHRIVFAIFAVYCIYRVCNSYIRMGWWFFAITTDNESRTGPKDALVLLIAQCINQLVPDIGVLGWSRIIGVFMSGAVFAAALNGVLRTAQRLMRLVRKVPAAIPLDILFVGQVVGVYVLSIATTLRFNLPRSMSGPIMSALVSPLKVSSVQLWNDTVLCLTSTVVLVVLVAMSRLSANEDIYDEEMGVAKALQ